MKLIIAGSRTLNPTTAEIDVAVALFKERPTELVCGMARGTDLAGKAWADVRAVKVVEYPVTEADWKTIGKKAGVLRNEHMGNYADCLLAFWDGSSTGTRHMIAYMHKLGKPFIVISKVLKQDNDKKD